MPVEEADSSEVRYIKLGKGGCWEADCIIHAQTIRLAYIVESERAEEVHQQCLVGNWDPVFNYWLNRRNGNRRDATADVREIKEFYQLPPSTYWVTFHARRLYWCHAQPEVQMLEDGSRIRRVEGSWSCLSQTGEPLTISNLDGRISKVQGYRRTLCRVALPDDVKRRIEGRPRQITADTQATLITLQQQIGQLIRGLWWQDFEILVDLIFARLGWQRLSVIGKTDKDIDLELYQPTNNLSAVVQIKSSTNHHQIEDYKQRLAQYSYVNEIYFVYHTMNETGGESPSLPNNWRLWGCEELSEKVLRCGLIDWLIAKSV